MILDLLLQERLISEEFLHTAIKSDICINKCITLGPIVTHKYVETRITLSIHLRLLFLHLRYPGQQLKPKQIDLFGMIRCDLIMPSKWVSLYSRRILEIFGVVDA